MSQYRYLGMIAQCWICGGRIDTENENSSHIDMQPVHLICSDIVIAYDRGGREYRRENGCELPYDSVTHITL